MQAGRAHFRGDPGLERLGEFLDPVTNQVRPQLVRFARPFMPAVNVANEESRLANQLEPADSRIFCGLPSPRPGDRPLPPEVRLRQRLMDHRRLQDSLFAHAEVIALEPILSPERAEVCLRSVWKERGMKALLDPALATRLRLSRSQRDEVAFLLTNKDVISDMQSEAQAARPVFPLSEPESLIVSERIAGDARDRLEQVDGLIWNSYAFAGQGPESNHGRRDATGA